MLRIVLGSLRIVTIGVMAVLIVFGTVQFFEYYRDRTASADIGKSVKVKITQKDTTSTVAKTLHAKGLIRNEWAFELEVRARSGEVIPGTYTLQIGMPVTDIADFVTGKSTPTPHKAEKNNNDTATIDITVREGWRTEQIADEMVKQGWKGGSAEDFINAVEHFDTSNYSFLNDRNNPVNPKSLEGFLFPDTYTINVDSPPEDLIQKMLDNFDHKFDDGMRQRASEMNLNVYQVLIFASLIERETSVGSERPLVADVYLNRYVQGMNLEADPTVQYAIGNEKNWWPVPTGSDLEDTDSPYNTYKNGGLPPGPICNPGLASIQAVLQPGGTQYLFFVAKNDGSGEHAFAETYDEQLANQDKYLNGGDGSGDGSSTDQSTTDQGTGDQAPADGSTDEEVPIEQSGG